MKKIGTILLMLLLGTGLAGATTVTMQLTGFAGPDGGPNTSGGVYTYPYYFSITNGNTTSTNVALICDSYDNEVWQNEIWTADQIPLTSLINGANGTLYEDAAWLFSEMGPDPSSTDAAMYNWAIWGLFSANARTQPAYTSSGASTVALPTASQLASFDFSGYSVYRPTSPSNATLNGKPVSQVPQEYIGYSPAPTPEPASLGLLGSGLIALGFKKFRRSK